MVCAVSDAPRLSVDGKLFRLGERRFYLKAVAYGTFAPNAGCGGLGFPSIERTKRDFAQIRQLAANAVRVYEAPPQWLLDLAFEHELKVFIDVPWGKHLCFLNSVRSRREALETVRRAARACAGHPAVFALSVANEIPADIVRWSGARAVTRFIDELIEEVKAVDARCLCTYSNFPPTEFLGPRLVDFVCFNVYLHQRASFSNYLARLQLLAESKPLVLGEFGIDSLREGEGRKCEILRWQIAETFAGGLAGTVEFSYTDDWWCGGQAIEDWEFGLTTRNRQPKPSFGVVRESFETASPKTLARYPRVTVVVASYNGGQTLEACLSSLEKLTYPDYEVILVDDGSTDSTPQIAQSHPKVRLVRHETNRGLSAARNTGIAAATGAIIAFTDSDCRADPDWLHYLVSDLLRSEFVGIGGPNLPPPEDPTLAAAVMAAPGGPAHVMLTDRQAEHIPGCNMAFYRSALVEVGGFDPIFRRAGDDVDLCWRLQQAGWNIGFSPAGFVWHYRRSTIGAYLKQQQGYGEAEGLLVRKHPENFNLFGGSVWRGRIYAGFNSGLLPVRSMIYRGRFASAGYQFIYSTTPPLNLLLCASLEYHGLVTLPLWVLSAVFPPLWPLAATSLALSVGVCVAAGVQAPLPKAKTRWWSRPLVSLLFFLQPIVRGWARFQSRLASRPAPSAAMEAIRLPPAHPGPPAGELAYWAETHLDRLSFVADLLHRLDAQHWPYKADAGWSDFDLEVHDTRWSKVQITTAAEAHSRGTTLLRCRLRRRWSLRAAAVFWLLGGFEFVVLSVLDDWQPWVWLALLSLPLFAWFLQRRAKRLHRRLAAILGAAAADWGLERLPVQRSSAEPARTPSLRKKPAKAPCQGPVQPPGRARSDAV